MIDSIGFVKSVATFGGLVRVKVTEALQELKMAVERALNSIADAFKNCSFWKGQNVKVLPEGSLGSDVRSVIRQPVSDSNSETISSESGASLTINSTNNLEEFQNSFQTHYTTFENYYTIFQANCNTFETTVKALLEAIAKAYIKGEIDLNEADRRLSVIYESPLAVEFYELFTEITMPIEIDLLMTRLETSSQLLEEFHGENKTSEDKDRITENMKNLFLEVKGFFADFNEAILEDEMINQKYQDLKLGFKKAKQKYDKIFPDKHDLQNLEGVIDRTMREIQLYEENNKEGYTNNLDRNMIVQLGRDIFDSIHLLQPEKVKQIKDKLQKLEEVLRKISPEFLSKSSESNEHCPSSSSSPRDFTQGNSPRAVVQSLTSSLTLSRVSELGPDDLLMKDQLTRSASEQLEQVRRNVLNQNSEKSPVRETSSSYVHKLTPLPSPVSGWGGKARSVDTIGNLGIYPLRSRNVPVPISPDAYPNSLNNSTQSLSDRSSMPEEEGVKSTLPNLTSSDSNGFKTTDNTPRAATPTRGIVGVVPDKASGNGSHAMYPISSRHYKEIKREGQEDYEKLKVNLFPAEKK